MQYKCAVIVTQFFNILYQQHDHSQIFTYLNNKITIFESKLKICFIYLYLVFKYQTENPYEFNLKFQPSWREIKHSVFVCTHVRCTVVQSMYRCSLVLLPVLLLPIPQSVSNC